MVKSFQKKISRALMTGLLCCSGWQAGAALDLKKLKFTYQSFDGETVLPCKAFIENELGQDLVVKCQDGSTVKKYSVHLWVTRYTRPREPRTSFEILYWVTDRIDPKRPSTSSTQWVNLKNESDLHSLVLSQGVDGDLAGLYLEIDYR
jgi:hypothetical protein